MKKISDACEHCCFANQKNTVYKEMVTDTEISRTIPSVYYPSAVSHIKVSDRSCSSHTGESLEILQGEQITTF